MSKVRKVYNDIFVGYTNSNVEESIQDKTERLETFLKDMVREETGSLDVDNETLISSSTNPGCRV
jgi:hypothetical protein